MCVCVCVFVCINYNFVDAHFNSIYIMESQDNVH